MICKHTITDSGPKANSGLLSLHSQPCHSHVRRRVFSGGMEAKAASKKRVAFLFTGQGSQRVGMGKELYSSEDSQNQFVLWAVRMCR